MHWSQIVLLWHTIIIIYISDSCITVSSHMAISIIYTIIDSHKDNNSTIKPSEWPHTSSFLTRSLRPLLSYHLQLLPHLSNPFLYFRIHHLWLLPDPSSPFLHFSNTSSSTFTGFLQPLHFQKHMYAHSIPHTYSCLTDMSHIIEFIQFQVHTHYGNQCIGKTQYLFTYLVTYLKALIDINMGVRFLI